MMLPTTDLLLLGPGPSPVSPRVTAALGAPTRSHLDPEFMALLDDIRTRLAKLFHAPAGSLTLAISGTGTSGMETVVANLAAPGKHALVVVNGYFGDRLAQMFTRYGCSVERLEGEWGRAINPSDVARALSLRTFDFVGIVHGETSTGVRNPVAEIAALARQQNALTIVDAVTTLGAVPVEVEAWGVDACYSCSQKGLGAPSGLAPIVLTPRALERRVNCPSFYLDLRLLEDYWVRRKYHHTMSAPLMFALHAALSEVEEEGLTARWQRHEQNHQTLVSVLATLGLGLLPSPADRLWSLNTIVVPEGTDEAHVRKQLLEHDRIEIGAGLGPLAGKIWRVGLMGSGSTRQNVDRLIDALGRALKVSA